MHIKTQNDKKLNLELLQDIFHDDHNFYPQTTAEVIRLVNFARANYFTLRIAGSGHSPANAIHDNSDTEITIALGGELKKISAVTIIDDGEHALVTVGAGCNLGHNPTDKTSTWENSLNKQLDDLGYALPTLGGISHQTVAGFLQTSSSGGCTSYGIADAIESIQLINGKGELIRLTKSDPAFYAAVVGMGLLGVITEVSFKCPKRYHVQGLEENKNFKDSHLAPDANGKHSALNKALFEDQTYAHINWFPQKYLNRVMHWQGNRVPTDTPIQAYKHPLKSKIISLLAALILKLGNFLDQAGGNSNIAHKIKAALIKNFVNLNDRKTFCDTWYKILPIDDQADVDGLINTAFSELWFPQDQIDTVMQRLTRLFRDEPQSVGNFIVEFYAAKASPFWLSPSYGRDSFRVDLYWWLKNKGNAHEYFSRIWAELMDIPGVRFHWGKHLPKVGQTCGSVRFDHNFIEQNYPQYQQWLQIREEMDPQQIFVSDFWRKILAIPKQLQSTYSPQLFNYTDTPKNLEEEVQAASLKL